MARGFRWGIYRSDEGDPYALRVDADYFEMEERGWFDALGLGLEILPRLWKPRTVVGFDEDGRRQFAIAATLDALIWGGLTSSFAISANDGALRICTITGRFGEKRVVPH